MNKHKIKLSGVPETLLISLNARCNETVAKRGVINDPKSLEIAEKVGSNFLQAKSVKLTNIGTGMRTIVFDNYTNDFLHRHPDGTVVNLACGLDTRFHRLDNGKLRWFDLDLPEVIAIREQLFEENDRFHFIKKSIHDFTWTNDIPKDKAVFMSAEGLFCYLTEKEVIHILSHIANSFEKVEITIEAIAPFMVKHSKQHPSLKGYDAKFRWGINSGKEIDLLNTGFHFVDEYFFMKLKQAKKRSFSIRVLNLMPSFANSMKIFRLRNY